jgi:hypothetical protein
MRQSVVSVVLLCSLMISCAGVRTTGVSDEKRMVCREHGIHHPDNAAEFAACFGIEKGKIDQYYIFEKGSKGSAAETDQTAARLKSLVADMIVDEIMKRLEQSFGNDLTANWRLESISMPVPFRTFVRTQDGAAEVKVFALVKKSDLEPQALIRFLPLEYKMKLIQPGREDYRELGNP